jgi:hypothetical protein
VKPHKLIAALAAAIATGTAVAGPEMEINADECEIWSRFARTITQLRDKGFDDTTVQMVLARQSQMDASKRALAIRTIELIYNDRNFRVLDPEAVKSIVFVSCVTAGR